MPRFYKTESTGYFFSTDTGAAYKIVDCNDHNQQKIEQAFSLRQEFHAIVEFDGKCVLHLVPSDAIICHVEQIISDEESEEILEHYCEVLTSLDTEPEPEPVEPTEMPDEELIKRYCPTEDTDDPSVITFEAFLDQFGLA